MTGLPNKTWKFTLWIGSGPFCHLLKTGATAFSRIALKWVHKAGLLAYFLNHWPIHWQNWWDSFTSHFTANISPKQKASRPQPPENLYWKQQAIRVRLRNDCTIGGCGGWVGQDCQADCPLFLCSSCSNHLTVFRPRHAASILQVSRL